MVLLSSQLHIRIFLFYPLALSLCLSVSFAFLRRQTTDQFDKQQRRLQYFAKGTQQLHLKYNDLVDIPVYVALAYLFNPYAVFNCIGQTSTVWSNLFLAGFFYCLIRKQTLLCCICLALETQRNLYPIELIVPAALYLSMREVSDDESIDLIENTTFKWRDVFSVALTFGLVLGGFHFIGYQITSGWSYLDATYGFM